MKLLIIGASRGIGKALLQCALQEESIETTVLARNPAKIDQPGQQFTVYEGDVRNLEDVLQATKDQDIVCSCIGVPITFKPVTLFSQAAHNLVAAAKENEGQKIIAVTGIGAGDSKGHGGFLYDKIFNPIFLRTIYADKDLEEEILKNSETEWLIVRPGALSNGPRTGSYRVLDDLTGITAKSISRLDVADFILGQIENPTHFGRTPLLCY